MIDKSRLKKAFNRSASTYDQYAKTQAIVGEELVTMVKEIGIPTPTKVLDVGSGTGAIALQIARLFSHAEIFGCDIALAMTKRAAEKMKETGLSALHFTVADAEVLPYPDHQFDLVVSSLTYQWLDNLSGALQEVSRILKHHGYFACSLLGRDTMFELKSSYCAAQNKVGNGRPAHFHEFLEEESILPMMEQSGFINIHITKSIKQEFHPDLKSIFFTLKAIGAQNVSREAPRGLGRKELFHWLTRCYEENFRNPSGLPLTYEIYYVTAKKG
jgi:malonyl-CoA O-methyltransferase